MKTQDENEFVLSEKRQIKEWKGNRWSNYDYKEENVKEFIRLLKEEIEKVRNNCVSILDFQIKTEKIIDKFAGDKLI